MRGLEIGFLQLLKSEPKLNKPSNEHLQTGSFDQISSRLKQTAGVFIRLVTSCMLKLTVRLTSGHLSASLLSSVPT